MQVVRFSVWDKDPTESEMIGQVSFLVFAYFSALIYRASVYMSACGYERPMGARSSDCVLDCIVVRVYRSNLFFMLCLAPVATGGREV
jgi:hypothetical protein